jgi:hypothetical protein
MNRRTLALITLLAALGGCAGEPPKPQFLESTSQTLSAPPAERAQVVFLAPINSIQGLVPVGIFEVEGANQTLLATTGAHSKAAVLLTPGRHVLMTTQGMGGTAHLLEANVEAGKRYYVLVRFIYANGFQLRPLRTGGPSDYTVTHKDFPNWITTTRYVTRTPDSDAFFERNKANVSSAQSTAWKTWLAKTPGERAELTLMPQDAITF